MESKNSTITQKLTDMRNEKETLEIELQAANEKLQLSRQKYEQRKNRHRVRVRSAR